MGEADIEEDILDAGLGEAEQRHLAGLAPVRRQHRLAHRSGGGEQDQPGQREAIARKEQLRGGVRLADAEQRIAVLHRGEGAAPEQAAQGGEEEDAGTRTVEWNGHARGSSPVLSRASRPI